MKVTDTLDVHLLDYEPLHDEPPEKRPLATKDFKEFKTLAVYSVYLVAANRARRRHMRVYTDNTKDSLLGEGSKTR